MSYKSDNKEDFKKLIKFAVTGVLNTGVDFIIFTILNSFTSVGIYVSQFAGYSAGLINSYIINRSWTFKSKEKFFGAEMVRFLVLGIAMMSLSIGIIHICSTTFGLSDMFAKIITTGLILVINFILSKLWVFKQ